jgi:cyclic pyranopterin monophosphate synthase
LAPSLFVATASPFGALFVAALRPDYLFLDPCTPGHLRRVRRCANLKIHVRNLSQHPRPLLRGPVKTLSHYDNSGRVRMVDVTAKPATSRAAAAHAFVRMQKATVASLKRLKNPKGNPLEIARIAGITAAKRTSELIPLCHPLPLTHVDVRAELCQNGVEITSEASVTGPTGVEMEALVGAAVAALTIYDMCKALERGMEITELHLVKKSGGRSGTYLRSGLPSRNNGKKNGSKSGPRHR